MRVARGEYEGEGQRGSGRVLVEWRQWDGRATVREGREGEVQGEAARVPGWARRHVKGEVRVRARARQHKCALGRQWDG